MKWLRTLIILMIIPLFTSYGERSEVDRWDLMWSRLYPEWFWMDQARKQDLIRLYELSENKWTWLPDLHEKPDRKCFNIYPRDYYEKRIQEIMQQ